MVGQRHRGTAMPSSGVVWAFLHDLVVRAFSFVFPRSELSAFGLLMIWLPQRSGVEAALLVLLGCFVVTRRATRSRANVGQTSVEYFARRAHEEVANALAVSAGGERRVDGGRDISVPCSPDRAARW